MAELDDRDVSNGVGSGFVVEGKCGSFVSPAIEAYEGVMVVESVALEVVWDT